MNENTSKWYIAIYDEEHSWGEWVSYAFLVRAISKEEAEAILKKWCNRMTNMDDIAREPISVKEVKSLEDLANYPSIYLSDEQVSFIAFP
jgi:hypothetical protein